MALRIVEFFGYTPLDPAATDFVAGRKCPFVSGACVKPRHGACSVEQSAGQPVIICPNRLYAEQHRILGDIAVEAFGTGARLTPAPKIAGLKAATSLTGNEVAVFGRYWGRELSIPQPRNSEEDSTSSFYIDYVLARLDWSGDLAEFTAVEVQTIDTTDSYRTQSEAFFRGEHFKDSRGRSPGWSSKAGLNWANVSKRILPQLIYKGYVLRREKKCAKGLFFVCPSAVLRRVRARLGGHLLEYPIAAGTITFRSYDLGPDCGAGNQRALIHADSFTTTVEQVAYAFVSPANLPEMGVYERAILAALGN
jgi:hypothetical protein